MFQIRQQGLHPAQAAVDKAMSYIADDIICDAPAGRLEGAAA